MLLKPWGAVALIRKLSCKTLCKSIPGARLDPDGIPWRVTCLSDSPKSFRITNECNRHLSHTCSIQTFHPPEGTFYKRTFVSYSWHRSRLYWWRAPSCLRPDRMTLGFYIWDSDVIPRCQVQERQNRFSRTHPEPSRSDTCLELVVCQFPYWFFYWLVLWHSSCSCSLVKDSKLLARRLQVVILKHKFKSTSLTSSSFWSWTCQNLLKPLRCIVFLFLAVSCWL